ncbi:MAG: hypothetical protein RLZZ469_1499 [Bacteroidota bacterium]|jgi:hypothetical protein
MLSESDLISKFAPRYSNTQLTNYIRGVYAYRLLEHQKPKKATTSWN